MCKTVIKALQTARGYLQKAYQKGITGSTLKIIAIAIMFVDHIGSVILERVLAQRGMFDVVDAQGASAFLNANGGWYQAFIICKTIGRIAFPIFCFLLIEGFVHTRNQKRYMSRMALFAVISEIPFDLAFYGVPFYWGHQNVFFTLLLGILAIAGIRLVERKTEWNIVWRVLIGALWTGCSMGCAILLHVDYEIAGIITIVFMYFLRRRKTLSALFGCVPLKEIAAFGSLIPISLYNGKRGRNLKWIFYLFYPVHIFLLYLIACAFGLGHITFL